MKRIKINGRIISATYKSTSFYGNPKFRVLFENNETGEILRGETANDAACAYGINNSCYKTSCYITYHITRNGNLILDYLREI